MKIYLAGPSGELDRVRAVAAELEEAGHEIVDKWWTRTPGVPDDKLPDAVLHNSTLLCREAIHLRAEALVALPGLLSLRLSTGTAVEVGMALDHIPVLILGTVEGLPFRTHCGIAPTIEHLLAELRQIDHARAVAEMDEAGYRAGDDVCHACGLAWTASVRSCLVCEPQRAPQEERAAQLVAGPPAPPEVAPAHGGSDVAVEEPHPAPAGGRAQEELDARLRELERVIDQLRTRVRGLELAVMSPGTLA